MKFNIFKTLNRLEKDRCWIEAKNKSSTIIKLTLMIYYPIILTIALLSFLGGRLAYVAIVLIVLMFASVLPYCNIILKPMIDRWYDRNLNK